MTGADSSTSRVARELGGLQLGLVNVSEQSRASIGLINMVRHGRHELHLVSTAREPRGVELHMGVGF